MNGGITADQMPDTAAALRGTDARRITPEDEKNDVPRIRNVIFLYNNTVRYQKDTISLAGLVVAAMLLTYSTGPSP